MTVTLPLGKKLVSGRCVFRAIHEYDQIECFESLYVAQGFTQVHDKDYNEIFAPVVGWESVRSFICMDVQSEMRLYQMDVETLNGLLSDEIYIQQPEGFIKPGQERTFGMQAQAFLVWSQKVPTLLE